MRITPWLFPLLLFTTTSVSAANHVVSIGDDAPGFDPGQLTVGIGDTVEFYGYTDVMATRHNVVADDGSFRCALGCDGEGGDGHPAVNMYFVRKFNSAGVVRYHDEVSRATGVIFVADASPFAIGPGISGAWYDPAQGGHGLTIEVLSDNRFYASWLAFNPAGTGQAWFTGVGTYSGNTATINAVDLPTGGRWIPNFDPTQIVHSQWGSLTFTFSDCNHGKVDFSSVNGYGTGSMNLTRLTQPAGLSCP